MTKKINELDLNSPKTQFEYDVEHMQKALTAADCARKILEEIKADREEKKQNTRS